MSKPTETLGAIIHAQIRPGYIRRTIEKKPYSYKGFVLVPLEHEPIEVTTAAVAFFSRPISDMIPAQVFAMHTIRQAMDDWDAPLNMNDLPSHIYMRSIIRAIGCLFFFDTLYDVTFRWDESLEIYGGYAAREGYQDYSGRHKHSNISIKPSWHNHMADILGTLLHECCHAFQVKFFCRDNCADGQCTMNRCRVKGIAVPNGKGTPYHGSAYYILASHVEARATELFGFKLDLNPPTVELINDLEGLGTFPNEAHRQLCHPTWQAEMLEFCRWAAQQKGVELD